MTFPFAFPCTPALASGDAVTLAQALASQALASLAVALSCFLAGAIVFGWGFHSGKRGGVALPKLPAINVFRRKKPEEDEPEEKRRPPKIGI